MSSTSEDKEKATYIIRYTQEFVVKSGDAAVVEEAARIYHEHMLSPMFKRTVDKLEGPSDTRWRIKMQNGIPSFYRMPLVVDSVEDIAKLEAEPNENAKVRGKPGEGYIYQPQVQPGAPNLDLRYTITSKFGGVWIDVDYFRRKAMEAQAEMQRRQGQR